MKKLMFGVAALAAGASMAIESANVVGYQNYEADEFGYANIAPAFSAIGKDGTWLLEDNIFSSPAMGDDTIMALQPVVFDFDAYTFIGFDGETCLGWDVTVWNPETFEPENYPAQSITLAKGNPIYFSRWEGEITVAGQVDDLAATQRFEFNTAENYAFSNPFPRATTISDLNSFCRPDDVFYVLDTEIFDFKTYMYLGKGQWSVSTPGWEDWTEETISDPSIVVFKAGQGGFYAPSDEEGRTWLVSASNVK